MKNSLVKAIKELLLASFYSITYIRNVFDDDVFTDYQFESDKPLTLKKIIRGKSLRSDHFIRVIEEGVFSSIDNNLISGLQIGFSLEDSPILQEVYLFEFDYKQGYISIQSVDTLMNVTKNDMHKLIRKLIIITQTFNPLLLQTSISIKLLFKENYPSGFQPKLFEDASNEFNEILFDGVDDFQYLGNVAFEEDMVGVRAISNVGKVVHERSIKINPFSLLTNHEEDYLGFFDEICFPPDMQSDINRIKNDIKRYSSDNFIPESIDPENEEIIGCECGLTHQSLDGDVFKCQECGNLIHMFCYAMSRGNFIPIPCITCRHQLMELEDLLKLRGLYKILFTKGVSLNSVVDLNDEATVSIINFLFKTNNFLTTSEFTLEDGGWVSSLTPPSDKFIDNKGVKLHEGELCNFIFAPTGSKYFDINFTPVTEFLNSEDQFTIDKFHQLIDIAHNSSGITSQESYLVSKSLGTQVDSSL